MRYLTLFGASAIALLFGVAVSPAGAQEPPQEGAGPQASPQIAPQSSPQSAQPEGQGDPADQRGDRIIVTAQKREETVQDIAVAVTAVTDTMRDEIGLTTLTDLTNFAPGLTFSVSNDRIGMRGVNRNANTFGIRTGISNYVDGVYYPTSILATNSRRSIFVDRTEVVRGPQGTLYGRDSIGGALNIISKRPTDNFETQFNIGAGSFDTMHTELSVSGPITDSVRYRVVGAREFQGQGIYDNVAGLESEGLRTDGYNYEFQLAGEIGDLDWFTRWGHVYWKKIGAPGARTDVGPRQEFDTRFYAPSTSALSPNSGHGFIATTRTQVGSFIGNPAVADRFKFNSDQTGVATLTGANDAALELVYHAPSVDVKYLGGYGFYKYNFFEENDGTPVTSYRTNIFRSAGNPTGTLATVLPARTTNYNEQRSWFSNEINILSTYDGPLQFIAGLYQYQENYSQPIYVFYNNTPVSPTVRRIIANPSAPTFTPAGVVTVPTPTRLGNQLSSFTANSGINDSYGVFTQVDYEIDDAFKVTGGIRYSTDHTRIQERGRIMCYYTEVCTSVPGVNVASPGADATDQAFYGTSPLFPTGAPGVIDASVTNPSGAFTESVTGDRTRRLGNSWSAITGMARLDWTPNDDTLIFFNYARGYKGGGFNATGQFTPIPQVDKEIVDSYEIGWKQEIPSLYLTVNSDLFYYDYQGYQTPIVVDPGGAQPPFNAFVGLPKSEFTGFELETSWSPTSDFTLIANYGYLNAEITEATGIDADDPLARLPGAKPIGAVIGGRFNSAGDLIDGQIEQTLAGNLVPLAPKNKVAVNARYTFNFEAGSLTTSATYNWQDKAYSSIFNNAFSEIPSWDQVNARLIWNSSDGRWTLIGFIENLLDDVQYDNLTNGLRRANPVGGLSGPRPIPQTLALCGTTPGNTISPLGDGGRGSLAESCVTQTETIRMPRWGGVELQFRF